MTGRQVQRIIVTYLHDIVMAAASFLLALYLRLGADMFSYSPAVLYLGLALFTGVSAAVFVALRLDRAIWRYASVCDVVQIIRAVILSNLIFLAALFLITRLEDVPRSLVVINLFVMTAMLAGPRLLYRVMKDRGVLGVLERDGQRRVPVLLVGAGDEADLFIREMSRLRFAPYRVVGVVDRKAGRVGRKIRGVDVLGTFEDMPAIVEALDARGAKPERMIITPRRVDGGDVRELLDIADKLSIKLSRLPRLTNLEGRFDTEIEIKPIDVEDLLGRPQTVLNRDAVSALISGRRVLVTGAGGTIGGELVRQISDLGPSRLILLDNSEYQLYEIDLEMSERHPELSRVAILGDVRDRVRMSDVFRRERPEVVFHAAALKHVPMVESNPNEGVLTNVIGTRNVADACIESGVEAMVLISTDKAINPASVMGATKRLAEAYCQSLDVLERRRPGGPRTRFTTVRFGNVLGSTGSVVPLFQRQLSRGGPLTVTDPEMKRYFLTVREAVELVLQACTLNDPHVEEGGAIVVLDMGEPVRIYDLAQQMIRLAGLTPHVDIEIVFTGMRPGEKLYEELFHGAEELLPTSLSGLQIATPRTADHALLSRAFDELGESARNRRGEQTQTLIRRLVPEYQGDQIPLRKAQPGE
ncbi:polysaccharide biosynthesis protein [Oceanibaculum pacificum]|uniref:Nucleotide sugar dehydratase n=1 Tax=Oceanibaculum pacificum TaxID=580166 RepID=A0A154VKP1_9PROT|nr:nucleoside-diphosphate sugar epimerase/dehydratase [Oceanibaculum pacificum]KZD01896.1 nucleotide sugar dehydratase [Oceanibaculum pacificum]